MQATTPRALIADAAALLLASGATNLVGRSEAAADAEILWRNVRGDRPEPDRVPAAMARRFATVIERRAKGEPVAQIIGHVDICGLRMRVAPGVFAPRPSSELLVVEAVRRLRNRRTPTLVDVATGLGALPIAVGRALPRASALGVDISPEAVRAARRNARRLGVANARFRTGDLLAPVPRRLLGEIDVVTVHPPYIPRGEVRGLPRELRVYEPVHTLTDGSHDGLEMVRRLAGEVPELLRAGGWLLVEIGPDRTRAASAVLRRTLDDVRVLGDRSWPTRVVAGRA